MLFAKKLFTTVEVTKYKYLVILLIAHSRKKNYNYK